MKTYEPALCGPALRLSPPSDARVIWNRSRPIAETQYSIEAKMSIVSLGFRNKEEKRDD